MTAIYATIIPDQNKCVVELLDALVTLEPSYLNPISNAHMLSQLPLLRPIPPPYAVLLFLTTTFPISVTSPLMLPSTADVIIKNDPFTTDVDADPAMWPPPAQIIV